MDVLKGDATKAKNDLNWTPKTSFDELVRKMVRNDIEEIQRKLGGRL